jgi:hypothetical protein
MLLNADPSFNNVGDACSAFQMTNLLNPIAPRDPYAARDEVTPYQVQGGSSLDHPGEGRDPGQGWAPAFAGVAED